MVAQAADRTHDRNMYWLKEFLSTAHVAVDALRQRSKLVVMATSDSRQMLVELGLQDFEAEFHKSGCQISRKAHRGP